MTMLKIIPYFSNLPFSEITNKFLLFYWRGGWNKSSRGIYYGFGWRQCLQGLSSESIASFSQNWNGRGDDFFAIESQYAYYKNALNAAQTTADMDRALAAFLNLSNPTNLNCLVKAKRCAAFMGMPKNTRFFQLAQRLKNWAYPSIASLLP